MASEVAASAARGGGEMVAAAEGADADDADVGVAGQGIGDGGRAPMARFRQPGSVTSAFINTLAATEAGSAPGRVDRGLQTAPAALRAGPDVPGRL